MKWRHWSILIILLLLNYLIFSAAFTQLARQQRSTAHPTRTPQPTYSAVQYTPVVLVVAPTNTPMQSVPIWTPGVAAPTSIATGEVTATLPLTTVSPIQPTAAPLPTIQPTAAPPTAAPTAAPTVAPTPPAQATVHVVQRGETLGLIAARYGVTVQAIVRANNIANPNLIYPGQRLTIPAAGQPLPTSAPPPPAANTPRPTSRPPTAVPTKAPAPTAAPQRQQFTAELIWRGDVAPNCAGPGISKLSVVRDAAGNPLNGVVVEVNCYGNRWPLYPTGMAGAYDAGHYDWSPGQTSPQDWTCTVRVLSINGQAVASSQEIAVHFDTNDCRPGGPGHQVAILNWTKWW